MNYDAEIRRLIQLESDNTELRERCAFYERTNAEQAAILNRVIAERDKYRKQVQLGFKHLIETPVLTDEAIKEGYTAFEHLRKVLCKVIAERDEYRVFVQWASCNCHHCMKRATEALAKHSPEDEIERARRQV